MRLPPSSTLPLVLLLSLGTVARANPHNGAESHQIQVAESRLAEGVSYTIVRNGNPNNPFQIVEDGEAGNPVRIRGVGAVPDGIEVSHEGSTFTLQGAGSGVVVLETQFRDVELHLEVDAAPACDQPRRRLLGNAQREVLVDATDLCVDPDGIIPLVTDVTRTDGGELDVTYNEDGTARVDLGEQGDGDVELQFQVADNGGNTSTGTFTISVRDEWGFLVPVPEGGSATIDEDELAAQISTADDPLTPVSVQIVDEHEQLEVAACCGGFTLSFPDVDLSLPAPGIEGIFVDDEGTLVEAEWEIRVDAHPVCEQGSLEATPKQSSATISLADYCYDPDGEPLQVQAVFLDGKEAEYSFEADTNELIVHFPYTKKVGSIWKVQAMLSGEDPKYDPEKHGTFTIVIRDDF